MDFVFGQMHDWAGLALNLQQSQNPQHSYIGDDT